MSTTKKEPGVAAMIIVLSVICLVVAALLGIINGITAPLIAENNRWSCPLTAMTRSSSLTRA